MFSVARLMFNSHVEHTLFVSINIVHTSIFIYFIIIYRSVFIILTIIFVNLCYVKYCSFIIHLKT